jgi:hypothetical protein
MDGRKGAAQALIGLLAAAQAVIVPATPAPELPPVTTGYSIVVARAVKQTDPIPIKCGADFCTSWFLGKFDQVENVAGTPLHEKFQARLEMGSPFTDKYRLAMVVETLPDGTLRIRAAQGFHYQTKLACFEADTSRLTPPPEGQRLVRRGSALCIK